jgi:ribosomal protein L5
MDQGGVQKKFEMINFSYLQRYCGMEFRISSLGIFMTHKTYVRKILKQFGMMNSNPTKLPMIEGTKLKTNMGEEEIDATQYRQVIGKLIYITNFRPCIIYVVNVVNRFMARP